GISYLLILIGFVGWLSGFLITMEAISIDQELPWGDSQGFMVDGDGMVYVGSGFYGVVQIYDSTGMFLHHFPARAGGGNFQLERDSIARVAIVTSRGHDRFTVDHTGKILQSQKHEQDLTNSDAVISHKGDVYEMGNSFFPSLDRNGQPFITQDALLTLISGPFPVIIYALAGMVLNVYLRKDSWNIKGKG
nr:hypothetical protein [Bacteroidota bacterium]